MRIGMFYPKVDYGDSIENQFRQTGNNTGNNVFWKSLQRLIDIERIPYDYKQKEIELDSYDAIVTTDLIWIRQGETFDFLEKIIEETSTPIIPISIGLQANEYMMDFKIADKTINLLKKMQERAILGVRGEYTAEILEKNGIYNYAVIGCPSMYYWNNENLNITNNIVFPNNYICNFKTFYAALTRKEKHFLSYSADHNALFVEQTIHKFEKRHAYDDKYYDYVNSWLENNAKVFFSIEDWMRETCLYDFSMGGRFHGNVISLWNNIKALFLITDSRTKELTTHFMLPSIEMENFDKEKSLNYYYELADYSSFNSSYKKRYGEFISFLKQNHISLSERAKPIQFAKNNKEKLMYEMKIILNSGKDNLK